jgi:hypothetical protein
VASLLSAVYDPASPAYTGIAPFDLSEPRGVYEVENVLSRPDEDLDEMFDGAERHPSP